MEICDSIRDWLSDFSLSNKMMSVTELAPEPWIVVGYFCMVTKKATRAVYFAQRVCATLKKSQKKLMHLSRSLVPQLVSEHAAVLA